MEAAPALDGEQRWRRPLLFEPISQRCDAHLADVRALSKLFDDGEAFLARELGDDGAVGSYRLRGSGLTVVVRHQPRPRGAG